MFALVDCNNFFASCEEVFNPKLSYKPLVILSNNDGCIIARSKKAKEIGIKMGDPAFLYKEQFERGEIEMLSSNFTLYADMSNRVMRTLESYSPNMEIYSIDEAFFELENQSQDLLEKEAFLIRQKVKKWTGISVSIGLGPTKTLAKLANEIAKTRSSNGVFALIDPHNIRSILENTSPAEIWGIGAKLATRLKTKKIYTAAQLVDTDDTQLKKLIGIAGYRTALELRSIPCLTCLEEEKRKSIVCSRSFKTSIHDIGSLNEAISAFASRAAEKLRHQKSVAGFMSVFIASSPFSQPYVGRACHIDIPQPTAYTPDLIRYAKDALSRVYQKDVSYKRAGVLLSHFCDAGSNQFDLLCPSMSHPKKEQLMQTIDQINRRYDKQAVEFAAIGLKKQWKSARCHVSPRYTTSWNELLTLA